MKPIQLLNQRVATAFYGRFPVLRPAQEAAIQPMIEGQNVVLSSGTGSGKTEAVLAPIVSRLWQDLSHGESLNILYIAPTKALVNDLEARLTPILRNLGLTVGIRHGDRDDLASGRTPNLLVTTPESLDVLLFRKEKALSSVRAVIIDEVHLLYNTQRGLQLSILLRRLRLYTSFDLQWAALSATVGSLKNVRDFLFGEGVEAELLQFPAHREIDAKVVVVDNEMALLNLIRKLVSDIPRKLLLFVNSRKECDRLATILSQDGKLASAIYAHYSSLSPDVRRESEREFSSSKGAICIATSTLELGIDIGDIDAVLLWDIPSSVESFLQKIGRANRRQNKTNVICLITDRSENPAIDAVRFLTLIEAAKKSDLPRRAPYELFGAMCQQFLGTIASEDGSYTRISELCDLIEQKPYATRSMVESILFELANKGYLKRHGFKNRFGASEKLYDLVDYRMIYGNYGTSSQEINVYHQSKLLGSVPAINLLRLRAGNVVSFAGKSWKISKATIDGIWLNLFHTGTTSMNFVYPGPAPGFDPFLASKMWETIHQEDFPSGTLSKELRELVEQELQQIRKLFRPDQIPFVRLQSGYCYFTFGGHLTNKAIALISKQALHEVTDISITVASPIDWQSLPTNPEDYREVFLQLFELPANPSLYQTLLPRDLQVREFLQDWLRDESVKTGLERLAGAEAVPIQSSCKLLPYAPLQAINFPG